MPFISFLSDYGLDDEFVGVVHGVIARISPEVRVVDVTHGIQAGNIKAGALALTRSLGYLPDGVVLAIVDPGVGTGRRAIAAATERGVFVGPDNGLLAPAVALAGGAASIVSIEDPQLRLPSLGATFDGRDVFAPAAAVLASGQAEPSDLGPAIDDASVVPLLLPLVDRQGDALRGEFLWQDRFGNLETNLSPADLAELGVDVGDDVVVTLGGAEHTLPWLRSFGDVEAGRPVLVTDSQGLLALAVREGEAAAEFNAAEGMAVVVRAAR